ncbi:MAG: complex I NDUFA9 subunit family protein [Acidocella sp. 20-57-95]|nr:MAG: complex I NDUFA9 subunit family protein [Acidocella sp. 20-57-95]OYV61202.1 MAG: complex I NDUFA9 subunit family protein [Acidocella sp. 21-58-7]HQT64700.1 complex I NDUFA9 subunit family protein [Acidocella sp.]HQU04989.1 complex I NDUFA9 subunit family protein [Acidocella sp.]
MAISVKDRKLAVVFGGSGFIGRYVVKRLAAAGYIVRVAVRDTEAALVLKPMGGVGQIVPLYAPTSQEALVARATEGAELVVNLTGILAESKKDDFYRVHAEGAGRIARLAASSVAQRLIQVSAIGADANSPSDYAKSKAQGEAAVRAAFPRATILRPSIVFGAEDAFFNRFAAMAAISPIIPIVSGATKFQPVYVGDVADAVMAASQMDATGGVFELGGPEVKSFHDLIAYMLRIIGKSRQIIDLPLPLARFQAALLERLPGKLLTRDQIKLLQTDNIVVPGALGLSDLGIVPTPMDMIVPNYLSCYRQGGRRRSEYRT